MDRDAQLAQVVEARIADRVDEIRAVLAMLYDDDGALLADVVERVRAAARRRAPALVELDRVREREPDWFQRPERVGYIAYADRFGGTLAGVAARIDHLRELGVDVLHLMSVLRARTGDNDGGYAIDDYRRPEPALGTLEDLVALADRLRAEGISLCLDLVMNHTSADHEWAQRAREGSAYHRALYRTYPDRTVPDAYEATLPEVFPDMSPGNFTWDPELDAWVWTTFREFQWDLDWSNPDVLLEMVDVLLHLANVGVEIVRLDAVAFTWKRLGTNCQNQPEVHLIAQALRAAVGMAAPATVLLAEAIVGPDELVAYLGGHELERRECDLAYHNQLMVQGWSMLAEQRVTLATEALRRLPPPPSHTTWFTYVRCHDDIGWAISDRDAINVGLDGWQHRAFLAAFYRGDYPTSFARGAPFSSNSRTGDERTCGMTATLCGIRAGLDDGDPDAVRTGIDRLVLLHAIAFGYGGIPMMYMGDELGQLDDETYVSDPVRAGDSRWRHRPSLDLDAFANRHDATTVPGAIWSRLRDLVDARRSCPPLHGGGTVAPVGAGHAAVFAWVRRHPRFGSLLGLANVSGEPARVSPGVLDHLPATGEPVDVLLRPARRRTVSATDLLRLAPHQVRWITVDGVYRALPARPD
jgi:amylosucrase